MVADAYSPLFSFVVEHGFFDDGVVRGLEFLPSAATARLISNTGLLVKPVAGGITLLFNKKDTESLQQYLSDPDGPFDLTFKVVSTVDSFQSCTDVSLSGDESILCFDSRNGQPQDDGRMRLHDTEYVSMINRTSLDSGSLRDVLEHRERRLPPLFIVNVRITEEALQSVDGHDGVAAKNYYIKFRERQVFWKYYLLGPLARESLFLSDLDDKASFVFSGREQLGEGREAVTYRSAQRLPLKASSHYRFQLKEKDNGNEKVIIKRLPVAEALRLGREVIDGRNEVVSEIYINC